MLVCLLFSGRVDCSLQQLHHLLCRCNKHVLTHTLATSTPVGSTSGFLPAAGMTQQSQEQFSHTVHEQREVNMFHTTSHILSYTRLPHSWRGDQLHSPVAAAQAAQTHSVPPAAQITRREKLTLYLQTINLALVSPCSTDLSGVVQHQ